VRETGGEKLWRRVRVSGKLRNRIRDGAKANRLNFKLRSALEEIEKPNSIQLYILSQCEPGGRDGRVINPDAEKLFAEIDRQQALRWERLMKSAEMGFAQACQDVAVALGQDQEAVKWHQRAAQLGLAEGMRYAGLNRVLGNGVERDIAEGTQLSLRAAEKGDVYAMVNLAMWHWKGVTGEQDDEKAVKWIDQAAQSGHWYGRLEKGTALLGGHYGYVKDRKRGLQQWQLAIATGNGEVLSFIANAYATGFEVEKNGTMAVTFAEAAYRQGGMQAAAVLAAAYRGELPGFEGDEELASFWSREAVKPSCPAIPAFLGDGDVSC
jgi:TPR repeat protein